MSDRIPHRALIISLYDAGHSLTEIHRRIEDCRWAHICDALFAVWSARGFRSEERARIERREGYSAARELA